MISRRFLLTLATASVTAIASAQEAPAPKDPPSDAVPSGVVVPSPGAQAAEALMPDQTPSLVKPESEPAKPEKVSKTETFEKDLLEKIRFREAKTKALADKAVIAAWDRSIVARTDVQRRTDLKEYYKLLYARILKIDPTLTKIVAPKAADADHRLTQNHIAPTVVENQNPRATGQLSAD